MNAQHSIHLVRALALAAVALLGLSCSSDSEEPTPAASPAGREASSASTATSVSGSASGASCGNGRGSCVAKDAVPSDVFPKIPVDTCSASGQVCVPVELVADPDYRFPSCVPSMIPAGVAIPGPNGQLGGCIPLYLISADFRGSTTQDDCSSPELACTPCNIPLLGDRTGACPAI